MPKSQKTNEDIHELRKILINAMILSKETEIDFKLLQKKFKLTQFGASCVMNMIYRGEYCPELESEYKEDRLRGENNTERIKFIEDIEPYEIGDQCLSDTPYETRLSYISMGFARWLTFEEARQENINVIIALMRYKNPQIPLIAEMIRNRDEEMLKMYFEDKEEEYIVEILKLYKFSDDDIEIVLDVCF